MRYMQALIMAGIITVALVPAVAVQATHTVIHDSAAGDQCGGSTLETTNERYPATFLTANPAGKSGQFGVTQTAFERNLLNGDTVQGTITYRWDYLQGFDGLVFRIVEKSEANGNDEDGRDWQAGTVPGTSTQRSSMTYDARIDSARSGVPLDLTIAFYHVEFDDIDGDGIQDPDEPITTVDFLGADGDFEDGTTDMRDRIQGSFPGSTTHFVVNLNMGAPRDNVVRQQENSLINAAFLQTTTKATITVNHPTLSCADPIHARCLQDLNEPRDGTNPSDVEDERNPSGGSMFFETTQCASVSRLL